MNVKLWLQTPNDTRPFDFLDNWLFHHQQASKALGKPLLLEEFGKNISIAGAGLDVLQASVRERRMPIFRHIYQALNASFASGDSLRGGFFHARSLVLMGLWELSSLGGDFADFGYPDLPASTI